MRVILALISGFLLGAPALAARPEDKQLGLQPAATPVMEQIHWFHDSLMMPIITAITLFVMALLLWIIVRFNRGANPSPSSFTHNTLLEVLWTGIPIIILLVVAVPSFRLLYFEDVLPEADVTIKAVGYQWYWEYQYPDNGEFGFASYMLPEGEVADSADYLLAVDQPMVAPAGQNVHVLVTAADVIHNWAMPAFGIKMDGIPGRVNEAWFNVEEPGTYYGQCSELCGRGHAFMPIEVEIVPAPVYEQWASAWENGGSDAAARVLASYKDEHAAEMRLADAR